MAGTGLVSDPVFQEHTERGYHPECPERLAAILEVLDAGGLSGVLTPVPEREATIEELERVHTSTHVADVLAVEGQWGHLDPDTFYSPASVTAALRAAGGALEAVEAVLDGRLDSAFCAVRPPGHHAEADRSMGFCLFNNIALAAAHALDSGVERVLIFDWDVHHGNGSQHSFEDDPRVLFFSTHQYPFYPGTGHFSEVGRGAGLGFTGNFSMPRGMGDADYLAAWDEIIAPVARGFDPELVLVSAGFDALHSDLLGQMRLTPGGYAHLAQGILDLGAPTVALLEGGYDVEGQARCAGVVVERLAARAGLVDVEPPPPLDGAAHRARQQLLDAVAGALGIYWPGVL